MSWTSDTASDFTDLLVRLDSFLVDHGHSLPPAYTGTGTGRVSQVLGTTTTVQETITVQFTDATNYSVSGSVTGSMGTGTIGTAFTHARLGFLVSSGDTAWAAGDTISWVMTPPWARCRLRGGAAHLASTNFDITKVVDGSTGTYTNPLATDLPQWGGIKLIAALEVRSIRLTIHATPGNGPRDYAVEYSDDPGSGWTVASSWTAQTWSTAYQTRVHDVTACGVHRYWRLRITAANGTNVDLSELTFYTATGGQTLDALNWYGDGIWRAPGNAGVDQIYVGARLIWNEVGACWTWKLGGFAGYVAGNSFEAQPGGYSRAWLSLWNASIPYWFQADGKAVKIVAKVTSQYEPGYLGFLDDYMAPGNWPYPLAVGGSMGFQYSAEPAYTTASYRYADASENHRAFWSPGGDTNYGHTNYGYGQLAVRKVDGSWITIQGYEGNSNAPFIWPTMYRDGAACQDLRTNLDGTVPLFPLVLHDATPNCYGELSGVAFVSGNNQSSENLITVGRVDWLVVQNIARVGRMDYAAFRLS